MDIFGGNWVDYMDKLTRGLQILREDDLCVICGDFSWGKSLEESLEDFRYIEKIPGRKIILKGNHDYWWVTASKMKDFFEDNNIKSIELLHNNAFFYEGVAICGTRGWLSDDKLTAEQNAKVTAREITRFEASLKASENISDNIKNRVCFFHYPPRFGNIVCHGIISLMNEYDVKCCRYGHLHSQGHRLAIRGIIEGIEYDIVSADYINFTPQRITYEE